MLNQKGVAVSRIALVKPEKKQMVENLILQMAQRGQITEKVWTNRLMELNLYHLLAYNSISAAFIISYEIRIIS